MLSKSLYDLCFFLSIPYDKLNLINNNKIILATPILEEIYLQKLFYFNWEKKLNSSFNNFKFSYTYDILAENLKFIKIKLNLIISFTIENHFKNVPSRCINEYIIILEHFHNKFKMQFLVEHEENPCLYNSILKADLTTLPSLIFCNNEFSWANKLSNLELLYKVFISSVSYNINYKKRDDSSFNITAACAYAEAFALTPNPKYKNFENTGGDCTNFISQILFAGGLKQNNSWKPYTMPWIRVEDLYLYLTKNKLAIQLSKGNSLSRGCVIQFYTPEIGRYFHNGFITYELQNNDFLYCCHSYNKLNYPLSQIYPHRYPVLRALKII